MTAIAPPRLEIEPSVRDWLPAYDLRLIEGERHATNHVELERIGGRESTIGLRLRAPVARGALANSDVVALAGGEALVDWVLRDARADAVRVLAFDANVDTSRLASAPFLAQVRRLILGGESALASPWLGPLQALRWIHPARLDAVPMPPQLRELRIAGATRDGTLAQVLALLQTTRLQRLELRTLEVPLDALAHDALVELRLVDCTLRGSELLAALPNLAWFAGARCGLDDADALALARSPRLRRLELAGNAITDAGVAAIATLQGLTQLDLSNTAITDAGVASLAALTGLTQLDLSHTAITDVSALAPLRSLVALDVSGTQVR